MWKKFNFFSCHRLFFNLCFDCHLLLTHNNTERVVNWEFDKLQNNFRSSIILSPLPFILEFSLFVCVWAHTHVCTSWKMYLCRVMRTTCRSQFPPSNEWVPEIWVTSFGNKCLYPLRHLASAPLCLLMPALFCMLKRMLWSILYCCVITLYLKFNLDSMGASVWILSALRLDWSHSLITCLMIDLFRSKQLRCSRCSWYPLSFSAFLFQYTLALPTLDFPSIHLSTGFLLSLNSVFPKEQYS